MLFWSSHVLKEANNFIIIINKLLKKATTLLVAFLFCIPAVSLSKESSQEIIKKAYELGAQRQRAEATNILKEILKKKQTSIDEENQLKEALEEILNTFFYDKAQQLYELGHSVFKNSPKAALEKFNESKKIEPDNYILNLDIGRMHLYLNECSEAQKQLALLKELNPYAQDLQFYEVLVYLCLKEPFQLNQFIISTQQKEHIIWKQIEIEYYFFIEDFQKVKIVFDTLTKKKQEFIENSYWKWRLGVLENKIEVEQAKKYIDDCKKVSNRYIRENFSYPFLCSRIKEVDQYLNDFQKQENGDKK